MKVKVVYLFCVFLTNIIARLHFNRVYASLRYEVTVALARKFDNSHPAMHSGDANWCLNRAAPERRGLTTPEMRRISVM